MFVRTEDNDNWRRVLIYVSPVLAFALLFNVPTFLEFYSTYDLVEANEPGSEENSFSLILGFLVGRSISDLRAFGTRFSVCTRAGGAKGEKFFS